MSQSSLCGAKRMTISHIIMKMDWPLLSVGEEGILAGNTFRHPFLKWRLTSEFYFTWMQNWSFCLAQLRAGCWATQPPAPNVLWFWYMEKQSQLKNLCYIPLQSCNCASVPCIRFFMNYTSIFWRSFLHHQCNDYANQNSTYTGYLISLQVQKQHSAC